MIKNSNSLPKKKLELPSLDKITFEPEGNHINSTNIYSQHSIKQGKRVISMRYLYKLNMCMNDPI